MKTLKTILSAFALVAILSTGVMAQATANVNVEAEVTEAITLGTVTNLDFGAVFNGTSPDLDPTGAAGDQNLGVTAQIGVIPFTAVTSNKDIAVSYPADAIEIDGVITGTSDAGTGTVDYDPEVSGDTDNDREGSTLINADGSTTGLQATTDDEYWLFVGGTLDLTDAESGETYTTSITVSVSYY